MHGLAPLIFTGTNLKRSLSRRCIVAQHNTDKRLPVCQDECSLQLKKHNWMKSKQIGMVLMQKSHKFCTIGMAMISVRLHCTVACLQMWNLASALPDLTRRTFANVWEINTKKLRNFLAGKRLNWWIRIKIASDSKN